MKREGLMTVRIESDGTPDGTKVFDAESGKEIACRSVKFHHSFMHSGAALPCVRLIVPFGELEYTGPAKVEEEAAP